MSESRPFHLIPRRELDALRDALTRRLTAWSSAWLASQAPCRIHAVEVFEPDAQGDEKGLVGFYKIGHGHWCAILRPSATSAALASVLFGSETSTSRGDEDAALVKEVAEEALDDLARTFLVSPEIVSVELESGEKDGLPDSASRPGAGSVRIALDVGGLSLDMVVSHAVLRGHVASSSGASKGTQQPLYPLQKALGKELVTATLTLGSVEISVQDLVSLQVEDVLALDRSVDEPAALKFDDSPLCCEAYLGGLDGKKAVRVVSTGVNAEQQSGAKA